MRVWDKQNAILDALRAMSWRRYMCAMWILGGQLEVLYEGQISDTEAALAEATLNLVREVVAGGNLAGEQYRAADLASRWEKVISEGEKRASGGLLNVWTTFEGLADEIAGTATQFYALDWVVGAATRRWRDQSGRRRVDPSEEIDDGSQMGRTLAEFERIVAAVADVPDRELDPVALKAQILQIGA
jgi:hypothetical protein